MLANSEKKISIPAGIRTRDLWIRSPTRYPLRYRDCHTNVRKNQIPIFEILFLGVLTPEVQLIHRVQRQKCVHQRVRHKG